MPKQDNDAVKNVDVSIGVLRDIRRAIETMPDSFAPNAKIAREDGLRTLDFLLTGNVSHNLATLTATMAIFFAKDPAMLNQFMDKLQINLAVIALLDAAKR